MDVNGLPKNSSANFTNTDESTFGIVALLCHQSEFVVRVSNLERDKIEASRMKRHSDNRFRGELAFTVLQFLDGAMQWCKLKCGTNDTQHCALRQKL